MYAGTKVNWHEVLMPQNTTVNQMLPLFLCAFSSEKGPEDLRDLEYNDFKQLYGENVDFSKYGQPLLQAHRILQAGGRILGKRIVATDATLANIIIVGRVSTVTENKVDANGNQIYIDENGHETTTETEVLATINKAKIKYESYTKSGAKAFNEIKEYADTLFEEGVKYPLFIIADIGRGKSIKRFRISQNYSFTRKNDFMIYNLSEYEDTTLIETSQFSIKPDAEYKNIYGNTVFLDLTRDTSMQFDAELNQIGMDKFIKKIAEITGYTAEDLYNFDILFAKTLKKENISSIILDSEGVNLQAEYGILLTSDTNANGNFGDAPFPGTQSTDNWATEAVKFFNGTFSDEIYDIDRHKIDFCVDANYPYNLTDPSKDVKGAIAELANFREDFYYFRDLGTNISTIEDVSAITSNRLWIQSPFIGDYMSTYDIIDPYTRKQIKVTMLHDMAPLLVNHYMNNMAAPVAGEFNGFIITNAIKNTLNVTPKITPQYDQKQMLEDLKVNYVTYTSTDDYLTVQSTYTTQDHDGPLSFANNVLMTQRVVKAIREYCPKIRFMLMESTDTDFAKYKNLIEDNVISKYKSFFKDISLRYTADEEMTREKTFNASLYCYYRDFAQGEIFDVFAIEGSPTSNPI